MKKFFQGITDHLFQKRSLQVQAFLDSLGIIAETYVLMLIAFPLMLVVMLSIMASIGGSLGGIDVFSFMYLMAFILIPICGVMFLFILDTMQPKGQENQEMSSPNQPQSAPASGPAVDTRSGRGSKDQSAGGGAIAGALKKITSKLAGVMAGIIFAGIFFWGEAEIALHGPEPRVPFPGLTGRFSFDRFLLLGGILCLIPPTIVYLFESKKRDAIDNNIPNLIRDIADAGSSGITLTRAIEISAERDYGPLTKEIKK